MQTGLSQVSEREKKPFVTTQRNPFSSGGGAYRDMVFVRPDEKSDEGRKLQNLLEGRHVIRKFVM